MPTLFRFLTTICLLAALGYAGMWALATFVEPQQREIRVTVPQSSFAK